MSRPIKEHLKTPEEFLEQSVIRIAGYLLEHLHSLDSAQRARMSPKNLANEIQVLYTLTGNLKTTLARDPAVLEKTTSACKWLTKNDYLETDSLDRLGFTEKGMPLTTATEFQTFLEKEGKIHEPQTQPPSEVSESSASAKGTEFLSGKSGRPEMAHVLFLDIVGHTQVRMEQQLQVLMDLQQEVSEANEFRRAQSEDQLIALPTGDGMALVFFRSPEAPMYCATEISQGLKRFPGIKVRMGVHSGLIYRFKDINGKPNVSGADINLAQRVMDCGDAGHILLSRSIAEMLIHVSEWEEQIHDLGEVGVKHGEIVHVYSFHSESVGNGANPNKFGKAEAIPEAKGPGSTKSPADATDLDDYPGTELAKVWRNTVINQLIPLALSQAASLSPSPRYWDTISHTPVEFLVLQDAVAEGANLTQFLQEYPEFEKLLEQQRGLVDLLCAFTEELHKQLTSAEIVVLVKEIVCRPDVSNDNWTTLLDDVQMPETALISELAGFVINKSTDIGRHAMGSLWQTHRSEFLRLREHEATSRYCQDLWKISHDLIELDHEISKWLHETREQLARRWKIAYQ
jgi:class 3 adenylate cyclase